MKTLLLITIVLCLVGVSWGIKDLHKLHQRIACDKCKQLEPLIGSDSCLPKCAEFELPNTLCNTVCTQLKGLEHSVNPCGFAGYCPLVAHADGRPILDTRVVH